MTKDNCKGMFSFNTNELLNSKDINKLWDAYEEVCCRIATMKTLNQNVPEDINKLKQDIVKKINRIVKLIIFLKEE